MFPMTIRKLSGRASSSSGGKDYHLILIRTADNRGMTIFRWAKANQWGNGWDLRCHATIGEALHAFETKRAEKIGRAYSRILVDKPHIEVGGPQELNRELGQQYWVKIGPQNLNWLSSEIPTEGMRRGADNTEYEIGPGGEVRIKQRPPIPIERVKPPEPTIEEHIKANPNWGTWG